MHRIRRARSGAGRGDSDRTAVEAAAEETAVPACVVVWRGPSRVAVGERPRRGGDGSEGGGGEGGGSEGSGGDSDSGGGSGGRDGGGGVCGCLARAVAGGVGRAPTTAASASVAATATAMTVRAAAARAAAARVAAATATAVEAAAEETAVAAMGMAWRGRWHPSKGGSGGVFIWVTCEERGGDANAIRHARA
jgi:hypothetical protein